MSNIIEIPHMWEPRPYQLNAWHALHGDPLGLCPTYKRHSWCWHRRSGKDSTCINGAATFMNSRVCNVWHVFPLYAQAKKAIWRGIDKQGRNIIRQAFPDELVTKKLDQEMYLEWFNGSTYQLLGSDNIDALVGTNPALIIFSEWALCRPEAWAFLRPILLENDGIAIFQFTPRGRNHAYKTHMLAEKSDQWFCQTLTVDDTNAISPQALAIELEELIEEFGPEDGQILYDQEYNCSFNASVAGSYYGATIVRLRKPPRVPAPFPGCIETDPRWEPAPRSHVRPVPYDPDLQVFTAWDLGISDDTVIWFVQVPSQGQINVIDYYANRGQGNDHYAKLLSDKPYSYAGHFFPHDGGSRESDGTSQVSKYSELGLRNIIQLPKTNSILNDINTTRKFLTMCYFDSESKMVLQGLEHLENYKRQWDDLNHVFRNQPLHDKSSHASDAFRYMATGIMTNLEMKPPTAAPEKRNLRILTPSDPEWWATSNMQRSRSGNTAIVDSNPLDHV